MEQCIPICVSFLIVLSQLAFSGECDNFRELHPE
jgi:hypothetical protein